MREHLYRGKSKKDGKWVFGYLIYSDFIRESGDTDGTFVNLETVGQYTGLTDIDNVKIFEGDILRVLKENPENPYDPYVRIYPVVFTNGCFLWGGECIGQCIEDGYEFEVVGNVHDSPQLLETKI